MNTHNIIYCGLNLEVHGEYYSGCLGDFETPPEPQAFEIDKVLLNGLIDITELLEQSYLYRSKDNPIKNIGHLEIIEAEILENNYNG